MVSPAVPTGSFTLLYRNTTADVTMQRCADSRKASVTDCTTAPLVSARAPLHTRLRLSHWLLDRRMLIMSHKLKTLTIQMRTCEWCIHCTGKALVMGTGFGCWALRSPWATEVDETHIQGRGLVQRRIDFARHPRLSLAVGGVWQACATPHLLAQVSLVRSFAIGLMLE